MAASTAISQARAICRQVLGCFFTDPNWKNSWEGVTIDLARALGPQVVRAYLSEGHFEAGENACPHGSAAHRCGAQWRWRKTGFRECIFAMVDLLADGRSKSPRAQSGKSHCRALRRPNGRGARYGQSTCLQRITLCLLTSGAGPWGWDRRKISPLKQNL